jgi:hypothetical protein
VIAAELGFTAAALANAFFLVLGLMAVIGRVRQSLGNRTKPPFIERVGPKGALLHLDLTA